MVAGDAFYMAPGHTTVFEEDTELVEFSPRSEYQKTLEVAQRNVAAMQEDQARAQCQARMELPKRRAR